MFPDVAAEDRLRTHERRVLIRGGGHLDAVGVGHEPRPAAAKAGRTGGFELRLKFGKAATAALIASASAPPSSRHRSGS